MSILIAIMATLVVGSGPASDSQLGECVFPESEAVADTLEPTSYYPLSPGNRWEYVVRDFLLGSLFREEVVGDTLIDGQTFSIVTREQYEPEPEREQYALYLSVRFYVSVRDSGIVHWQNDLTSFEPVAFGAAFRSCYTARVGAEPEQTIAVDGGYDSSFSVLAEPTPTCLLGGLNCYRTTHSVGARKGFHFTREYREYAYGYGLIRQVSEPSVEMLLTYARIGGESIGIPLEELLPLSTAVEPGERLPARATIVAYPAPASEVVHLTIQLPRPGNVSIRVYDVAGRLAHVVASGTFLDAGPHTMTVQTDTLAGGSYFVVLRMQHGEVARTRLVVVRT